MRIIDPLETFERTKTRVEEALEKHLQIEGRHKRLEVSNVRSDDRLDPNDIHSQLLAKAHGRTWGIPIVGDVKLVDVKTGKVLDKKKGIRLGVLPKPTPRLSYIVDGTEYIVKNQLRLRPGAYTLGDTAGGIKTQVNTSRGDSFFLRFNPGKDLWAMKIRKSQALPLLPILRALGVPEDRVAKELGDDALAMLKAKEKPATVEGLYKTLFREAPESPEQASAAIKEYFEQGTEVDPETTKLTLGKPFKAANGDMILAAMKKQLAVSQGKASYDERDSLVFKSARMLDDHLGTRLDHMLGADKREGRAWRRSAVRRLDRADDVIRALNTLDARRQIIDFFKKSSLSASETMTNPVNVLDTYSTTTILGEGGVTKRTTTDSARALHPSVLGIIDPIHTPESGDVGATGHLASNVVRLKDGNVAAQMVDAKTGKTVPVTAAQSSQAVIARPEDYDLSGKGKPKPKGRMVRAWRQGKLQSVPAREVTHILPDGRSMFDTTLNMMPWLESVSGARGVMGSRMFGQALSLVDEEREAPLVQTEAPSGETFEQEIAKIHLPTAPVAGKVTRVQKDWIEVTDKGGKKHKVGLHRMFRMGTGTQFLDMHPVVKTGDTVKKDQPLADSNFTRDGALSLGKNLTVAYLPYKGLNFEDGIVMSESAAKKMTSQHLHEEKVDVLPEMRMGKRAYRSMFPGKFTNAQYDKLDDDGVIKPGEDVDPGDPIILAMSPVSKFGSAASKMVERLMKRPYRDAAVTWTGEDPGKVHATYKRPNVYTVQIYARHPTKIGDKFAGRYGNKGVVSAIIRDAEMPHWNDEPVDVLMNPIGVPGRINDAQVFETAIAKSNEPYVVRNFTDSSNWHRTMGEMKRRGVTSKEDLKDPTTGKTVPQVMVGKQYIMKLDKEAEKAMSARGIGQYTMDELPGRTDTGNAQQLDHLTLYAMLAHGARANIRDMATYKASRNDEFWRAIRNREPIPAPKSKAALEKFMAMLKQLGVNVRREGDNLRLTPMTDNEVLSMSAGEIKDGEFVRAKDLKPKPGNLFDPVVTGGLRGTKWSHFTLPEPIPNPTFVEPIKKLTGIKQPDFDAIMASEKGVRNGQVVPAEEAELFRGPAIKDLLSRIDVKKEIKSTEEELATTRDRSNRNRLYRRLRYLKNLDELKINPADAFTMQHVPVIPPRFRALVPRGNDLELPPVNHLYKGAITLRNQINEGQAVGLPEDVMAKAREDLYHAVAAIQGYEKPLHGNRDYKGIMTQIAGDQGQSPKEAWFQKSIFKHKQDVSGRAVIRNGPDLHVDEVGLPEEMAWTLYEQFIIRELRDSGMRLLDAQDHVKKRTQAARRALDRVVEKRPVLLNRAPSLHKHSVMAFKPVLVTGRSMKLHPFVYKGFNADNDGDAMAVHVPVTDAAVQEAAQMFPSKNVFSVTGQLLTAPSMESQWGLWLLTKDGKKTGYKFKTSADAAKAFEVGKIGLTDVIKISGKDTTLGRAMVNGALPKKLRDPNVVLTKGKVKEIISTLAREDPKAVPATLDHFKDLGYQMAYESGATIGMEDIKPWTEEREKILARARARAKKTGDVVKSYEPAIGELAAVIEKGDDSNELISMLRSGAVGKELAVRQILTAPVLFKDSLGKAVPSPVEKSFSEGLSTDEYWSSLYGARLGVIGRSKSVEQPGALANALIQTTVDNVITMQDCKTTRGIEVPLDEALGRFPAGSAFGMWKNQPIDERTLARFRKKGVKRVLVRSPLRCEAGTGTCARCWGLDENGQLPRIGTNVGVLSGHALTEPSTQLSMNAFHTGGVHIPGESRDESFEEMKALLEVTKNLPNKAVIAKATGKVEKIEENKLGGRNVWIGGEKHYVSPKQDLRPGLLGRRVRVGQSLTPGNKDPRELRDAVGFPNTQEYMAKRLQEIYAGSGIKVPLKHFETVVRSSSGDVEVKEDPTGTFMPGQTTSFGVIDAMNAKKAKPIIGSKAKGMRLMERVPGQEDLFGKVLTSQDARRLGRKRVLATPDPIRFEPTWRGVTYIPQNRDDWLSRLAFRGLKNTLQEGAAQGMKSNLHGQNPLPAVMFGAELKVKPGPRGEY